jgi:hypothetical protein
MAIDPQQLEIAKFAMEEYKALHAEILQRNTIMIQVFGACIAGIVALIGTMAFSHPKTMVWLILLLLVIAGSTLKIVDSDTRNASRRIIEIEEYVQKTVQGDDKNPLSWERRWGILKRDYLDRFKAFNYDAER